MLPNTEREISVGKKSKAKIKKVNPHIRKTPIQKLTNKFARVLVVLCFVIIVLNIVFGTGVAIPIGLYFLTMYLTTSVVAVFLVVGLISNIQFDKKLKEKRKIRKGDKVFIWVARPLVVIFILIDLVHFWFPMSADLPRLITGNYQLAVGTVEDIEYPHFIMTSKGKWLEQVQNVYFKEASTGKVLKIVFHANNAEVTYNTNRIFYLPFTKWGISAD